MPKTSKTKKPPAPKMPASFAKALETIKAKGFSHIKVELEARLRRSNGNNTPCTKCRSGWNPCTKCSGRGFNTKEIKIAPYNLVIECRHCEGDGSVECGNCNGRGYPRGGASVEWCQAYLEAQLSPEVRKAMVYGKFYDDGSVDSEYTFTLPTRKAYMVLEVMVAFRSLSLVIGNGMSEENAGMHISVLPSGSYPCEPGLLNQNYIKNFTQEVAKLLPALYFLASHKTTTRKLTFRCPQISSSSKRSAIYTHSDTCLEYRIFDPCLYQPEAFYDKVEVIAATLKYYSDLKVDPKYSEFNIWKEDGGPLTNWFDTLSNYDGLMQTIKEIKPYKSVKRLKDERGLAKINKTALKRQLRAQKHQLVEAYEQTKVRYERDQAATLAATIPQIAEILTIDPKYSSGYPFILEWAKYQCSITPGMDFKSLAKRNDLLKAFVVTNARKLGIDGYFKPLPSFEQWVTNQKGQIKTLYKLTPVKPIDEEDEGEL